MTIQVYRDAYSRDAGNIDFGEQQTSGLSAGTPTQWFNAAPKKLGKPACLGLWVKCIYVLTATGAESPVSGSDALDPIIGTGGRIDVSPGSGTAGRSQNLTRQFVEFAWAATTNTSFSVASLPTFASAGTSTVTVSFFIPTGGVSTVRLTLPGALTASYSSGVTVSYTSITTQVVSTTFAGVCAFREEKSASIGSGMQSMLNYLPKDIAPDAAFMQGESSSTITQVLITGNSGWILSSTDTDALQSAAGTFAPIAGTTYTTTAGFVLTLDQQTFSGFQLYFASATTHYIGFLQVTGGGDTLDSLTPAPTAATPAVTKSGVTTPSGGVAAVSGGQSPAGGGGGGIAGKPAALTGVASRLVYK